MGVHPGPPGLARPPRPQLASCRPKVCNPKLGTELPGGLQQSSRRLLAEMPGKKARKNAQPSPPRAPAGRDQKGSAGILARAGAGPGPGAGAGVDVSVGPGSVCFLRDSRSGHGCALSRAVGAPPGSSSGLLPRTMETAREGAGLGIAMQLHFSGCLKPLLPTLLPRLACPLALPRGRGERKKVQLRASATRENVVVTARRDAGSSASGPASPRFPSQASSRVWTSEGPAPGVITLHADSNKSSDNA